MTSLAKHMTHASKTQQMWYMANNKRAESANMADSITTMLDDISNSQNLVSINNCCFCSITHASTYPKSYINTDLQGCDADVSVPSVSSVAEHDDNSRLAIEIDSPSEGVIDTPIVSFEILTICFSYDIFGKTHDTCK